MSAWESQHMAWMVYSSGSPIHQGIAFSLSMVLYEPIWMHILTYHHSYSNWLCMVRSEVQFDPRSISGPAKPVVQPLTLPKAAAHPQHYNTSNVVKGLWDYIITLIKSYYLLPSLLLLIYISYTITGSFWPILKSSNLLIFYPNLLCAAAFASSFAWRFNV